MPDHCPHGSDGSGCHVSIHHWRPRKTGPEHPVAVAVCKTHGVHFTLYPLGHVPYGRRAIAPFAATDNAWKQTIFHAAVDAAHGEPAWSREADGGPGWWTQRRQIARAAAVVGLRTTTRRAERVAERLGVGLAVQARGVHEYATAPGFRARARAVAGVLDSVTLDGRLPWRLLGAGWLCGAWPRPWLWDGASYRSFPAPERGAVSA